MKHQKLKRLLHQKEKTMENNFDFLSNFIVQNSIAGGISLELSEKVKSLWDEFKENEILNDCAVIEGEFGMLGSLIIRNVIEAEPQKLKYESGSYDFCSIKCITQRILWTDYSETEPYNRHCGLYCDGVSFEQLGKPVIESNEYREFNQTNDYESNLMFGVWGYDFNTVYGSIKFGMSIKKNSVDEFIKKLRILINKPEK